MFPTFKPKRFSALPLRWKSLYAILLIAIIVLASMSFVQNIAISSLTSQYDTLKSDYDKATAADSAIIVLEHVSYSCT
jgi:hypothetical protein